MPYSKVTLYKKNKEGNSFITVYYQHGGTTVRHRTGESVKHKDFVEKTGKVKSSDPEHKRKNEQIAKAHSKVEYVIEKYVREHEVKPSGKYVREALKHEIRVKKKSLETDVLECYDEFLSEKSRMFNTPEFSKDSLKDYVSNLNALKDFQVVKGSIFTVDLNNRQWLDEYNTFLSKDRPNIKGYTFKTSAQNDKTRAKRFGVLKNFGRWLVKKGYLKNMEVLDAYKVRVVTKTHYALSPNELRAIQYASFKTKTQSNAIDMFIICCHTGVRFSDLIRIRKSNIKKYGDLFVLGMTTKKTKERVEIGLTEKALTILEKHDYNMNLMTSQKANYYIHQALKSLEQFHEQTEYGTEGDSKPLYELITLHTGRRTFITNLVNDSVSLNAIMKMTGHKKLSTLQQYINPDYSLMKENIRIFDEI